MAGTHLVLRADSELLIKRGHNAAELGGCNDGRLSAGSAKGRSNLLLH